MKFTIKIDLGYYFWHWWERMSIVLFPLPFNISSSCFIHLSPSNSFEMEFLYICRLMSQCDLTYILGLCLILVNDRRRLDSNSIGWVDLFLCISTVYFMISRDVCDTVTGQSFRVLYKINDTTQVCLLFIIICRCTSRVNKKFLSIIRLTYLVPALALKRPHFRFIK